MMPSNRTYPAFLPIAATLLAVCTPALALAQGTGGGVGSSAGAEIAASSGTMIAAALETIGYHTQAEILSKLSKMIETAGALIYVAVALSAVMTVAMLGQYRSALWLLVGPPVFFFVSGIQIPGLDAVQKDATPPEWRFGPFRDTENVKEKFIENQGETAKVSMVFHQYNLLISEISQKLISVFTQGDIEKQMIFMARQRTLEDLFGAKLKDDAGVFALASYFMVVCSSEVADARTMATLQQQVESGRKLKREVEQDPVYVAAKDRYCSRFDKHYKPVTRGPWLNFIYTLSDGGKNFTISREEHISLHRAGNERATCAEMWDWVIQGTQIEAARTTEEGQSRNFDQYAFRATGTETWKKTLQEVVDNAQRPPKSEQMDDPCPFEGTSLELINDDAAVKKYIEMVSGLMLKKVLSTPPNQLLFNRIASDHSGVAPQERNTQAITHNPGDFRNQLERQRASQYGEGVRYKAYVFIHLLPYVQGFLLYVLALLYPFFALMILLPGQAGQFFTWMALWAWAKSWDVGWAIIMVADEIAWELMPKHGYFEPDSANAFNTPVNLLEGAYQGDPGFSIGMYWTLLATMVGAVPIISAHALLGTKRAIASRLIDGQGGISDWAESFQKSAMDKVGARQLGQHTRIQSQQETKAQLSRGTNLKKQYDDMQEKAKVGDKGMISAHGDAVQADAQNAFQAQMGYLQQGFGHAQRATGNAAAGNANIAAGKAKTDAAYQSLEPGGEQWDRTQDSGMQAAFAIETMGKPALEALGNLPRAAAQLATFQKVDPLIKETSFDSAMDIVLRDAGLHEDRYRQFIQMDPEKNKILEEAMRIQLYRKALAGNAHTQAEMMMYLGLPYARGYSLVGGPIGTYTGLLHNLNLATSQNEIGYEMKREISATEMEIISNVVAHHSVEASYDPQVILSSEREAYLSIDRGGEFFAHRQFMPGINFDLERSLSQGDANWHFGYGALWGNSTRWAFQPVDIGGVVVDKLTGNK